MKFLKILLTFIMFNTMLHAIEEEPTQEEVAKLYVATFNRAPDSGGLNYWINSSGLMLSEIAQSFFEQTETQEKYPDGTSNRDFIQAVYNNLFNRDPDTEGWEYWEGKLNNNEITRDRFIEAVINGALDNDNGLDKTILDNKTEIGLYFANAGLGNDNYPSTVMSGVTADSNTVLFIKEKISTNNLNSDIWSVYNINSISNCSNLTFNDIALEGKWNTYYNYSNGQITKALGENAIWEFDCNNNIYAIPTGNEFSMVTERTYAGKLNRISNEKIRVTGPNGYADYIFISSEESSSKCFYVYEVFEGSYDLEIWCKE